MKRITRPLLSLLLGWMLLPLSTSAQEVTTYQWEELAPQGEPTGRHECSFVEYRGKFYLLGGRGDLPVNVYDPQTNRWEAKGKTPKEIHHFQAIVYDDAIYLVGAMTGKYPKETPLAHVWIYHPENDSWEKGDAIPTEHQRGGAGCVVYNEKIYLVGGIEYGHTSGTTNIFSEYDPRTGSWRMLTKAPHIRDHFPAAIIDNKLYCVGGRNGSVHYPNNFSAFFGATEAAVDVYDFATQTWCTLAEPLPAPSAAGGLFVVGKKLIYFGGESNQSLAHSETRCYDTETGKWTLLAPMCKGMHASAAIPYNGAIYWAAGSYKRGGSNLSLLLRFAPTQQPTE